MLEPTVEEVTTDPFILGVFQHPLEQLLVLVEYISDGEPDIRLLVGYITQWLEDTTLAQDIVVEGVMLQ